MKKIVILVFLFLLVFTFSAFSGAQGETVTEETGSQISEENLYQVWATPAEYEAATGKRIEIYGEAPQLKTLVAAGALPPVAERLPKEPLVARGSDGLIGKYGGTLNEISLIGPSQHSSGGSTRLIQGWFPFYKSYPNVAKSFEMTDNAAREWVIELREGMKWSDGAPFTADDLVFGFNDFYLNEELSPSSPRELKSGDELATIEKIDDYTVKYTFPSLFRFNQLNRNNGWAHVNYPKHWLSQFHASYADKDELEKLVQEGGFASWTELFENRNGSYADKPTITPWILRQIPPGPQLLTRNPYYWVIDEEGNQLPYVDEWHSIDYEKEVVQLKVLAGESDYSEALDLDLYPEVKKAEQEGKTRAVLWSLPEPNVGDIQLNLTIEDPIKRQVFRDKRFRFALSHALDRNMINELAYLGLLYPAQVAPSPLSPFYHERLSNTAIEYDTDKANALLDEMGLDKRGGDGFRLGPDGKDFQINMWGFPWTEKFSEMATDMIKAVGINVNLRIVGYWNIRDSIRANSHEGAFIWEAWGTEEGSFLMGTVNHWLPIHPNDCVWAPLWNDWVLSGGERGEEPPAVLLEALEYYEKAQASLELEEQQKWMEKVLDIAADNLWSIGTLTAPGFPYLIGVNPKLRNFPSSAAGWWYGDWGRIGTWFFEE